MMKLNLVLFISIFIIVVLSTKSTSGFFLKGPSDFLGLPKSNCERIVQSSKYKCSKSQSDCRSCCYFDLNRLNERYGDRHFFLKEAILVTASSECLCEFCKKPLEDFTNNAWFRWSNKNINFISFGYIFRIIQVIFIFIYL